MYNYHSDIIWRIDIALLALSFALCLIIIAYALINDYVQSGRRRALLNIKRGIFELLVSDKAIDKNVCLPFTEDSTAEQFLDIQSNRDREAVFFNDAEQKLFKSCYISEERIAKLERTAENGPNKWRRIEAITCLGYSGSTFVPKVFDKLLRSRDEDILYFSALALGQIKTIESAKLLLSFLKKNVLYRYKIASFFESFPKSVSGEVVKLTEEEEPALRIWGLNLLSRLDGESYLNRIESLTTDESGDVRAAACECLGAIGTPASRVVLEKCLRDTEWRVRFNAIRSLANILGEDSLPMAINMINDGSLSVIDAVKKVITDHVKAAIPNILALFKGKDEFIKKVLIEAIETGVAALTRYEQGEIIGIIRGKDKALADRIENSLKGGEAG